jgi:hypothetical protein
MTDDQPSDVLGALPRTRPHRRSDKREARQTESNAAPEPAAKPAKRASAKRPTRAAKPAPAVKPAAPTKPAPAAKPAPAVKAAAPTKPARTARPAGTRLRQPAQPEGTPSVPPRRRPTPARRPDIVGTAVQAAAELAEIGLSLTARTVRGVVSRLPRP